MDIAASYTFDAPREMVWEALQDPLVLGTIIEACHGVEKIAEHEYTGTLDFKAGAIRGVFNGTILLTEVIDPESYKIEVNGIGTPGVVKVLGGVRLEALNHQTRMHYEGHVEFRGRMASTGQRILEIATKSMIQLSIQALNGYFIRKVRQQEAEI